MFLGLALVIGTNSTYALDTVTYYHLDALGSPVAATDEQGNVKWREDYRPYGSRLRNEATSQDNTRYHTGHSQDNDTGLVYAGARFYDPVLGRFMAKDPQGFKQSNIQSFNRYTYGNNNPYKYVDPDGENSIAAVAVVGIALLAVGYVVSKVWQDLIRNQNNSSLIFNESDDGGDSNDASNAPPVPDTLVGDQSDPRSGQRRNSRRHTSGGLLPEHGGTNDAEQDFDHLTGGESRPAPERGEGARIGPNGISIRPGKAGEGSRIDIPANSDKPHETLHY